MMPARKNVYKSAACLPSLAVLLCVLLFDRGGQLAGWLLGDSALYAGIYAANKDHTSDRLLKEVVPGADSFSEKEGEVPVRRAYRTDPATGEKILIGYAVVTADIQPEPDGFSGPIDTLIGMDLDGTIVGLKVIYYKESHRYTIGDFFSWPGYEDQFLGKTALDKFSAGRNGDIDGIAKATISVKAMVRGVRQTVRAVTKAYIDKG
jgi:NosR/NirI family nitrous oxide reductase transcriptional regulator